MAEDNRTDSYLCQELKVTVIYTTLSPMVTYDEKQAFSNRLNLILDKAGVPPKGKGRQGIVAKAFHVTQKGARKWLEGEAIPQTKRMGQFIELYKSTGVTGEWLLHGNPDYAPDWIMQNKKTKIYSTMSPDQNNEVIEHSAEYSTAPPDNENSNLVDISGLTEENKKIIRLLIKNLSTSSSKQETTK